MTRLRQGFFFAAIFVIFFLSNISSAGNPVLTNIPENSWVYLNPDPSQRYQPVYKQPDAVQQLITSKEPFYREYSGIVYGNGKIFYFGGAHSGYSGNDVEVYDIGNNIWSQSYKANVPDPSDPVYGCGGSEFSYVDPNTGEVRPLTIHGYGRTTYHPGIKQYFTMAAFCVNKGGSPGSYYCAQNQKSLIGYDPTTKKWSLLYPGSPDGIDLSQYDPRLGGILVINPNSREVLLYKDGTLTSRNTPPYYLARSGGSAYAYINEQNAHYIAAMGHCDGTSGYFYRYDAVAQTATDLTGSMPSVLQEALKCNFAMAYDSNNKKLLGFTVVSGSPQVWIYDFNTWQQLPTGNNAPQVGQFDPGRGRAPIQYDPIHNIFIFVFPDGSSICNSVGYCLPVVKTWAYRYKNQSGPDPTPPAPPRSLRIQ